MDSKFHEYQNRKKISMHDSIKNQIIDIYLVLEKKKSETMLITLTTIGEINHEFVGYCHICESAKNGFNTHKSTHIFS